jgi:hypothetical protein
MTNGGIGDLLDFWRRVKRCTLLREGILFVHLDDNAVHETKLVLDDIFGRDRYCGEIVWKLGTGAKSRKFFSIQHNTLLVYSKGKTWHFDSRHPLAREPFAATSLSMHFRNVDAAGRRYRVRSIGGKDYIYYEDEGRAGSVWSDVSYDGCRCVGIRLSHAKARKTARPNCGHLQSRGRLDWRLFLRLWDHGNRGFSARATMGG